MEKKSGEKQHYTKKVNRRKSEVSYDVLTWSWARNEPNSEETACLERRVRLLVTDSSKRVRKEATLWGKSRRQTSGICNWWKCYVTLRYWLHVVRPLSGTFGPGHALTQTKQHAHTDQIWSDDLQRVGRRSARLSSPHTHKTHTLLNSAAHSEDGSFPLWVEFLVECSASPAASPTCLCARLKRGKKTRAGWTGCGSGWTRTLTCAHHGL